MLLFAIVFWHYKGATITDFRTWRMYAMWWTIFSSLFWAQSFHLDFYN